MFLHILVLLLFLVGIPGVNEISVPGVALCVGILVLAILPACIIRKPLYWKAAFIGSAVVLSGLATLGFLHSPKVFSTGAIVSLMVAIPASLAFSLRANRVGSPRISLVLLAVLAGISAILGSSSLPVPETAKEPIQRFLALPVPLFCIFLLTLLGTGISSGRSRIPVVMIVACVTLTGLGSVSLYRAHTLFRECISAQGSETECDPDALAKTAARLALNSSSQLKFLENEAGAYWARGNLCEAVRYTIEAQSLREDLRLLTESPPLKRLHPSLWILAFGRNSTDWSSPDERMVSFSFIKDLSTFWCVDREGKVHCIGADRARTLARTVDTPFARTGDVPCPEPEIGITGFPVIEPEDRVASLRSEDGRWAILYTYGTMILGDVAMRSASKELRCLTDREPDVWRDLAATPNGGWAALSKDGEIRLVDPAADSFEDLVPPNESWRNNDVVRGFALLSDGRSGYYVDLFGGIHPFGRTPIQPCHLQGAEEKGKHYFDGGDVMVRLVALDDGRRLLAVDRFGGIHDLSLGADGATWSGSLGDRKAEWNPVVDVEHIPELGRLYLLHQNGRIEVMEYGER